MGHGFWPLIIFRRIAAENPKMARRFSAPKTHFLRFSLIFLSLLFLEKARKTTQKSKDFYLCRTPKIPGKEGENAQKSKEIPCNEKSKEIQKSKERKIRVWGQKENFFFAKKPKGGTGLRRIAAECHRMLQNCRRIRQPTAPKNAWLCPKEAFFSKFAQNFWVFAFPKKVAPKVAKGVFRTDGKRGCLRNSQKIMFLTPDLIQICFGEFLGHEAKKGGMVCILSRRRTKSGHRANHQRRDFYTPTSPLIWSLWVVDPVYQPLQRAAVELQVWLEILTSRDVPNRAPLDVGFQGESNMHETFCADFTPLFPKGNWPSCRYRKATPFCGKSYNFYRISWSPPVRIYCFPPPGNWGQKATRNGGPQFSVCLILAEGLPAPMDPCPTPACSLSIARRAKVGGSQKGGFQKGGFGGCSPGTKTGTRVRSPKPPFYETALLSPSDPFWCWQKGGFQKGGFGGCSPGTKTGTRVRSPKPPFYETALLSPSDKGVRGVGSQKSFKNPCP